MSNSMRHWNGCQICAIDTETTGLDANFHEVVQICILPLDSDFNVRKDVMPFYINLKPDHPDRADAKALKVNRLEMAKLLQEGHDREKAKDMLEEWVKKLGLPCTKWGNRKKIIPLGQNYGFDISFIKRWLGVELYYEIFHYHHRDTMIAAAFLNDIDAMKVEKIRYPKIGLKYLCNLLNVELYGHHDALQDCRATAEVYKKLIQRGFF